MIASIIDHETEKKVLSKLPLELQLKIKRMQSLREKIIKNQKKAFINLSKELKFLKSENFRFLLEQGLFTKFYILMKEDDIEYLKHSVLFRNITESGLVDEYIIDDNLDSYLIYVSNYFLLKYKEKKKNTSFYCIKYSINLELNMNLFKI